MRHLIDLCTLTLLHRLPLAPSAAATIEADSEPVSSRHGGAAATPCAASGWAGLAAAADRWFRRRIESRLAGRTAAALPGSASADERPTPSRYY